MDFIQTEKQKQAIEVFSGDSLHTMAYGGSRSGKTFIIIFMIIVRACFCRSRHGVFRKTFNSLKTSIWLDTLPKVLKICFPLLRVKYNKTDFYLEFPNGSEIWFCGLDDDKRVEKVLGKEFSTLYFNECSEISYYSIQVVLSRLAEKTKLRKKVYYDMNPPPKSHWSYWLFFKFLDPIDAEPIEEPEQYSHILMNPTDNLANIDENYLKILEKMPQKEKDRFLYGIFAESSDGQAYYEFKREDHVQETKKAMGQILIGMDFNVMPMTAVICQIINNQIVVFDEKYLENSDTFRMVSELEKSGYRGATVIPDSTGKNRKTSGKSDFTILKDAGFSIPSVKNPLQVDRVNNVNRLLKNGQIVIGKKCRKLINDLEKVSWKDGKLDQKGENAHLTHISDCLGYIAWKYMPLESTMKPVNISKYR